MRRILMCLAMAGCFDSKVTGTVVYSSVSECPTDRPLTSADLDCLCGQNATVTLIDTTLAETCDELWCHAESLEVECVYASDDTGTGDTGT